MGSVGKEMCIKREPCTIEDIETVYSGECGVDKQRTVKYNWIEPKVCEDINPQSVKLPTE